MNLVFFKEFCVYINILYAELREFVELTYILDAQFYLESVPRKNESYLYTMVKCAMSDISPPKLTQNQKKSEGLCVVLPISF